MEETFQAAKGLAGLDEHQVRRWTSWHRWITLAILAHAFLVVTAAIERTAATSPSGSPRWPVARSNACSPHSSPNMPKGWRIDSAGHTGDDDTKPVLAQATTSVRSLKSLDQDLQLEY